MEVILKKTKITNSILKQTLRSNENDMNVGEILGWCIWEKSKYIVIYRSDTKSLSKFPMFKDIILEIRHKDSIENEKFIAKIILGGNYTPINYTCNTERERENFVKLLKLIKHQAEIKSQFFL